MRVVRILCQLPRVLSFSFSSPPQVADGSVPRRTSTTSSRRQCSPPDLNHQLPTAAFPAGPQPPHQLRTAVFCAGPQPPAPDGSVTRRTSTTAHKHNTQPQGQIHNTQPQGQIHNTQPQAQLQSFNHKRATTKTHPRHIHNAQPQRHINSAQSQHTTTAHTQPQRHIDSTQPQLTTTTIAHNYSRQRQQRTTKTDPQHTATTHNHEDTVTYVAIYVKENVCCVSCTPARLAGSCF